MRVKHMKTQRSGGIGSGRGTSVVFVCSSSRKDPEIIHVCIPRLALALSRPRAITSKIHQGQLCRGRLRLSNERL